MNVENHPEVKSMESPKDVIVLSKKDVSEIHPHSDDPMVISVKSEEWNIKRILVDQGSSVDILYLEAFERLCLVLEDMKPFRGSLVRFSREHVQVKGYITLRITFGDHYQAKGIKVKYLPIDTPSSYNIILGPRRVPS